MTPTLKRINEISSLKRRIEQQKRAHKGYRDLEYRLNQLTVQQLRWENREDRKLRRAS